MSNKVSIYSNNKDVNSTKTKTIDEIIEVIKSNPDIAKTISKLRQFKKKGNDKQYNEGKSKLSGFTSTGVFSPSKKNKNIESYTYVITLDIDKIKDRVKSVKEEACKIEETLACFFSPGNDGLKILVKIDAEIKDYKIAYNIVKETYEVKLNVTLDNTPDISRLCYISSDPEIYHNPNAKIFMTQEKLSNKKISHALKLLESKSKIAFKAGSRNTFVFQFACYCNLLGVDKQIVLDYSINEYLEDNFDKREIEGCINNGYKDKDNFNTWSINTETTKEKGNEHKKVYSTFKEKFKYEPLTEYQFLRLYLDEDKDASLVSLCECYKNEISEGFEDNVAKRIFHETIQGKDLLDDWDEVIYSKLHETKLLKISDFSNPIILNVMILEFKIRKLGKIYTKIIFSSKFLKYNELANEKLALNEIQRIVNNLNQQIIVLISSIQDLNSHKD